MNTGEFPCPNCCTFRLRPTGRCHVCGYICGETAAPHSDGFAKRISGHVGTLVAYLFFAGIALTAFYVLIRFIHWAWLQ